jgi:hypothetical protein
VPNGIARLFHGIQWRLKPTTRHRVNDCIGFIEKVRQEHLAVSVPTMVLLLAAYDQMQRTKFSTQAATIYCSIVQTASCLCGNSVAAKLVENKYIELLRPYILPDPGNGNAANSSSSGRASSDGAVGQCPDCAKYYSVLGLNGNATEAEVKQAYKDLAKVWHPDRFSTKPLSIKSCNTVPGPTEGSWSMSPTRISPAWFGTAFSRECISGTSTMEVSSTTNRPQESGWASFRLNRPVSGSTSNKR